MGSFDDALMGVGSGGSGSAIQPFSPISDLKETKDNGIKTSPQLMFPRDMDSEFYPEAIKFSVYERAGVSYDDVKKNVVSAFATGGAYVTAATAEAVASGKIKEIDAIALDKRSIDDINQRAAAQKTIDNALSDQERVIDTGKRLLNDTIGKFTELKKQQSFETTTKERHLQSIFLSMPQSVNFAEGVDWQGTDLGVIGGLKSGALNTDNGLDYGILTGAGAALGGAAGLAASLIPGVSGIAGTVVGALLGNSNLQSGIESTFGVKTNPFKEQTFQGVGFRPFDFSFNFRARSADDVIEIQKIISSFRSYSKPTFKKGSNGSIFKYPKEFRIEFLRLDQNNSYVTNPYIPEIKFCVCTAVNTNFTALGWKSFEGGAPVDISLQITFQETEIITGEDVDGDTNVGRFKEYTGRF
jgi:hypothetical protein|tara:strand:+ start:685 stop:1923 length:1239 start_codon:yes stop_codon:yes gene_type:complete